MTSSTLTRVCTVIILWCSSNIIFPCSAERIRFNDTGVHETSQDYPSHNIFISTGTTLSLVDGHAIEAPPAGDEGEGVDEDAVRVEDSIFYAREGVIKGGLGIGGTGVTITYNRDSEIESSRAEFEKGVKVYGGDAMRETTTKGGDAVQILHRGSIAVFYGGEFAAGLGCTSKACGEVTNDGNSLLVLQGKAIVKGGTFSGNFYNEKGTIEVHGCVENDEGQITGYLLDGSSIDVKYVGEKNNLNIIYLDSSCPSSPTPQNADGANSINSVKPVAFVCVLLGYFIHVL